MIHVHRTDNRALHIIWFMCTAFCAICNNYRNVLHSPECADEARETSLDKERHLVTNMEVGILAIGTELLLKRSLHARHSWLQAQPTTSQASQAAGRVQKYSRLIATVYSECAQSVLTRWRLILHAGTEAEIQILSHTTPAHIFTTFDLIPISHSPRKKANFDSPWPRPLYTAKESLREVCRTFVSCQPDAFMMNFIWTRRQGPKITC